MKTKQSAGETKFDFDIGHLAMSPCRHCSLRKSLPECSQNCRTLNELQRLLSNVTSCSNSFSELEEYSLSRQDA